MYFIIFTYGWLATWQMWVKADSVSGFEIQYLDIPLIYVANWKVFFSDIGLNM